jgi:hypothetical protein
MDFLEKYREEKRKAKIRRYYGGQANMAKQCGNCVYWTMKETPPKNFGCHYPGRLTKTDFEGATCMVMRPA